MTAYHYHNKTALRVLSVIIILAFLIAGCAQNKTARKEPSFNRWKAMAESSKGHSPSHRRRAVKAPKTADTAVSTPVTVPAAGKDTQPSRKPLPDTPVSMKMHDIDVTVLLRALAKAADQNIMINEKVKGRANINISRAPWNQVFLGLLRTHGLTYAWEGDIIRIMTIEDMEQDLKRETQKRGFRLVAPLVTTVVEINYAEAAKLKTNIEKFLTLNDEGKPLGSVMVDEHTNSLIIQAIQTDIDAMMPIIEKLDQPTPQILIEAHIVEANKNTARELGVQWGGLSRNGFWITPGANSSGVLGNTLDAGINPTSGMVANFPAALVDGIGLTIGFAVEDIGSSIIAAQLSALQQEGKLNILSSPSITTLDNQKAIIESGRDVPYQTVEDKEVKIEYKKAVLSLEVTPHVIDGQTLKMKIKTKKDEIDEATSNVQGNPVIITKLAETNVLLFDGQTTVIGGLTKERTSKSEDGVPALKDIPILGWLFKSKSDANEMEDLLIFITPHILKAQYYEVVEDMKKENAPPASDTPATEATPQ